MSYRSGNGNLPGDVHLDSSSFQKGAEGFPGAGQQLGAISSASALQKIVTSASENLEKFISLGELFDLRAPHVYLVKVEGDSMQGAGIFSGDVVIVGRGRNAEHGDIIITAVNNEPVCKRLHRRDGLVILKLESPDYPTRYILESDDFLVRGVVRFSVRDHAQ